MPAEAEPQAIPQAGPQAIPHAVPMADLVARLRRAMRKAARSADPGNPLSVAQLELLSSIAERPGARPGRLARLLRLAPNSVTTLVNALQARGLVTKTHSTEDARAIALELTEAGRAAVTRWQRLNTQIVETALADLDTPHQQALAIALPALHELIQAIDARS
jgi:DNA-binding MarR family transcriptional regulator